MINSVSRVMASSYKNNSKQNNSTAFRGKSMLAFQPQASTSPISGIIKSLKQIPFLKGFLQ